MKNKTYNLESPTGLLLWQYNNLPMALMGLTNRAMLGENGISITCEGATLYTIKNGRIERVAECTQ